ncbi:MAG: hypothetical protein HPY71_06930 [Firmicutes bacterium]|nr:hypothetical protein [Bacillota bacterium]
MRYLDNLICLTCGIGALFSLKISAINDVAPSNLTGLLIFLGLVTAISSLRHV